MSRIPKYVRLAFFFILAVVAISYYRSAIDGTPLIIAFDLLGKGVMNRAWELLLNPILLTGILIIIVLLVWREPIPELLKSITEVSAGPGGIRATFKTSADEILESQQRGDEREKPAISDDVDGEASSRRASIGEIQSELLETDEAWIDYVMDLPLSMVWYLLKVADKTMTSIDHLSTLGNQLSEYKSGYPGLHKDTQHGFRLGYLVAMRSLDERLFKFELVGENSDGMAEYASFVPPKTLVILEVAAGLHGNGKSQDIQSED